MPELDKSNRFDIQKFIPGNQSWNWKCLANSPPAMAPVRKYLRVLQAYIVHFGHLWSSLSLLQQYDQLPAAAGVRDDGVALLYANQRVLRGTKQQ